MAKRGMARYVLLDLGNNFAAGKVIRFNPDMITLEVYRGKHCFRPGYKRATVHKILSIDRSMAVALGRFAYPPDPTDVRRHNGSLQFLGPAPIHSDKKQTSFHRFKRNPRQVIRF